MMMSNKNLETITYFFGVTEGRIYLTGTSGKDATHTREDYKGIVGKSVELQVVHGNSCFILPVMIEPQQLMELGALFLAIAGKDVDFDSADALLEGYNLKGKEVHCVGKSVRGIILTTGEQDGRSHS